MKLYAQVQSEASQKVQGGNKFVDIDLYVTTNKRGAPRFSAGVVMLREKLGTPGTFVVSYYDKNTGEHKDINTIKI